MTTSSTSDLFRSLGPSYSTDLVHVGVAQHQTGALRFFNSSSVLFTGLQAGNTTAELTYTLPTAGPSVNGAPLVSSTVGVMSWATSLGLGSTSNQIVLGTTNTITLTAPAPSASRVYTLSDVGADASFVMTEGTQTILGAKTFQLATSGSIETLAVRHTDNTNTGSHARLQVRTGGSSGGDPYVYFDDNTAGDWSLGLDNSDSNRFKLCQGGVLGTNDFWSVDLNGNIVPGSAALSTSATDGFLYIPTCAGAPTGTPTSYTGRVPIIFDTTNNKLYIYDGSWLGGTTPGAWV